MGHLLTVAWELVCGLGILFVILKLLGKTQFSQITPFDFISALILGELVGNAVYDKGVRIIEIIFASLLWGFNLSHRTDYAESKKLQKAVGRRAEYYHT